MEGVKNALGKNVMGIVFLIIAALSALSILTFFILPGNIIALVMPAVIMIVSICGLKFMKGFEDAVKDISAVLAKLEEGNYNVQYISRSKGSSTMVERHLNNIIGNVKKMVIENRKLAESIVNLTSTIKQSADETTKSIQQVTTTIMDVAQGSSEQAQSMKDTTELIAMVTEAVTEVSRNSEDMEVYARDSEELIHSSQETVDKLKEYTESTIKNSNDVAEMINEMNQRSEQISSILGVISQIASQTNLLALNAAIEAARAGEAGRGFSVVAEEIKHLAEQSSASAKDISNIIRDVLNDTRVASDKMSETYKMIEAQRNIIFDIIGVFERIKGVMSNVISNVNVSKLTLNEVNYAVVDMNTQAQNVARIVESNAAATEEVSAASQEQLSVMEAVNDMITELYKMAGKLDEKMQEYKI